VEQFNTLNEDNEKKTLLIAYSEKEIKNFNEKKLLKKS